MVFLGAFSLLYQTDYYFGNLSLAVLFFGERFCQARFAALVKQSTGWTCRTLSAARHRCLDCHYIIVAYS